MRTTIKGPEPTFGTSLSGKSIRELHEARHKIAAEAREYLTANENNWSEGCDNHYQGLMAKASQIKEQIERKEKGLNSMSNLMDTQDSPIATSIDGITFLSRGQSAAKAFGGVPNGAGEFIRGLVLGEDARGLSPEVSAALNSALGSAGAYSIPTELSGGVLDLARAKSALSRAGAQTAIMKHNEMTLVRLTQDPTFQTKVENFDFAESEIVFGALVFRPIMIGSYISMSRELAEDAVNFPVQVEESLSRALAVQLDKMPIQGAPSGGFTRIGMINDTDIGEDGSIGTLAWSDIASAATTIRGNNHEPNAVIMHPTKRDPLLDAVASGSGEYVGVPPSLSTLQMLDTTNIPAANALVGDFTKLLWMFRSGPMVEVTTVGDDTFRKHALAIKIWWRGDYAVLYPNAFRRLSGIS